jgi:cytochrome b561
MQSISPKYDSATVWLHAALATGVVVQLVLSAVMHVPAGPGLGVRDWHREAFEIHARVGLFLTEVIALHWLWSCLPFSRPGVARLFPWLKRSNRTILLQDFKDLFRGHAPSSRDFSPLAGTVHGLGLSGVTGGAIGGVINYVGYFTGAPIPRGVLHWVALWHIAMGYAIWTFVIGHVFMALLHWFSPKWKRKRELA